MFAASSQRVRPFIFQWGKHLPFGPSILSRTRFTYVDRDVVPYPKPLVMQVVRDVDHYQDFIPGVLDSRVIEDMPATSERPQQLLADIRVGVNQFLSVDFRSLVNISDSLIEVGRNKNSDIMDHPFM